MPAFGEALSDDEIWAALAYIKSTWPPETLAAQEAAGRLNGASLAGNFAMFGYAIIPLSVN
jgi:mono/diheme cytochrome c family protein